MELYHNVAVFNLFLLMDKYPIWITLYSTHNSLQTLLLVYLNTYIEKN